MGNEEVAAVKRSALPALQAAFRNLHGVDDGIHCYVGTASVFRVGTMGCQLKDKLQ
jgi:hypothetical protein